MSATATATATAITREKSDHSELDFTTLEKTLRDESLDKVRFQQMVSQLESEVTSFNAVAQFKLGLCYYLGLLQPISNIRFKSDGNTNKDEAGKTKIEEFLINDAFENAQTNFSASISAESIKAAKTTLQMVRTGIENNVGWALMQNACVIWKNNFDLNHNPAQAAFNLANCLERGLGLPKDLAAAEDWYKKAADMNHIKAKDRMNQFKKELLEKTLKLIDELNRNSSQLSTTPLQPNSRTITNCFITDEYENGETGKLESFYPFEKKLRALSPEQFSKHFSILTEENTNKLVEPLLQCQLGFCYLYGIHVEASINKAHELFNAAANQGLLEANYLMGILVSHGFYGTSIEELEKVVFRFFKNAAGATINFVDSDKNVKQVHVGCSEAQFQLSKIYSRCNSVVQPDPKKTEEYLQLAANADHALAQYHLAKFYSRDKIEMPGNALHWLQKAAINGQSRAQYELACYYYGKKNMELYLKWLKEAADNPNNPNSHAQRNLGESYYFGSGKILTRDSVKALEYLKKAAASNNKKAQAFIEKHYKEGFAIDTSIFRTFSEVVTVNTITGIGETRLTFFIEQELRNLKKEEFEKLASQVVDPKKADPITLCKVGLCYAKGIQATPDLTKALELLTSAVKEHYHVEGCQLLAWFYEKYLQQMPDYLSQAFELYQSAYECGSLGAAHNLARFHLNGFAGLTKSIDKTMEFYHFAARNGHFLAQKHLAIAYLTGLDNQIPIDKTQGLMWLHRSALQSLDLQIGLANAYYKGLYDLPLDKKQAAEWWERAARNNDPQSQFNIGVCYERGEGVTRDLIKAQKWFTEASKQNHPGAQNSLGFLLLSTNVDNAVELFIKAGVKGYAAALYNLGMCYFLGIKYPKDITKALTYFKQASKKDYQSATDLIKECYDENGQLVNHKIPQFSQAHSPSIEFRSQSDYVSSTYIVTSLFALEKTVALSGHKKFGFKFRIEKELKKLNKEEVQKLISGTKDTDKADSVLLCKLGLCYLKSIHVGFNFNKALEYFQIAARKGFVEGYFLLGILYSSINNKSFQERAFRYFKEAATLGCLDAKFHLAACYFNGVGTPKDKKVGFDLLIKTSEAGHAFASLELARIYELGDITIDVPLNKKISVEYYKLAADRNDIEAQIILKRKTSKNESSITQSSIDQSQKITTKQKIKIRPDIKDRKEKTRIENIAPLNNAHANVLDAILNIKNEHEQWKSKRAAMESSQIFWQTETNQSFEQIEVFLKIDLDNIISGRFQPTKKHAKASVDAVEAQRRKLNQNQNKLNDLKNEFKQLLLKFEKANERLGTSFDKAHQALSISLDAALKRNDLKTAHKMLRHLSRRLGFFAQIQNAMQRMRTAVQDLLQTVAKHHEEQRKVIEATAKAKEKEKEKEKPHASIDNNTNVKAAKMASNNLAFSAANQNPVDVIFSELWKAAEAYDEASSFVKVTSDAKDTKEKTEVVRTKTSLASQKPKAKLKSNTGSNNKSAATAITSMSAAAATLLPRNIELENEYRPPLPANLLSRTFLPQRVDIHEEIIQLKNLTELAVLNGNTINSDTKVSAETMLLKTALLGGMARLFQMLKRIKGQTFDPKLANKLRNNLFHMLSKHLFVSIADIKSNAASTAASAASKVESNELEIILNFVQSVIKLCENPAPKLIVTFNNAQNYINTPLLANLLSDCPRPSLADCNEEIQNILTTLASYKNIPEPDQGSYAAHKLEARYYLIARFQTFRSEIRNWLIDLENTTQSVNFISSSTASIAASSAAIQPNASQSDIDCARKFLRYKPFRTLTATAIAYRHLTPQDSRISLKSLPGIFGGIEQSSFVSSQLELASSHELSQLLNKPGNKPERINNSSLTAAGSPPRTLNFSQTAAGLPLNNSRTIIQSSATGTATVTTSTAAATSTSTPTATAVYRKKRNSNKPNNSKKDG